MKKIYSPPEDKNKLLSVYETEDAEEGVIIYRQMSKKEIDNYYSGKSNLKPDEQGRTILFKVTDQAAAEKAINSYWNAAKKLQNKFPAEGVA